MQFLQIEYPSKVRNDTWTLKHQIKRGSANQGAVKIDLIVMPLVPQSSEFILNVRSLGIVACLPQGTLV